MISKSKHETKGQKIALYNTETLYRAQEKIIKVFDDYRSMISGAKYNTISEKAHPADLALPNKSFRDYQ